MTHRLLAIVTSSLDGPEPAEEIRRLGGDNGGVELRVVAPAVEASSFRHTLGDIDEPKAEARERLREALDSLRGRGVEASGKIGDPDPIQAAQDALLEAPADEVLIFEHESEQSRWFEEGLFERAQAGLEPPLRMVRPARRFQGRRAGGRGRDAPAAGPLIPTPARRSARLICPA